jgi:hypothetical protein
MMKGLKGVVRVAVIQLGIDHSGQYVVTLSNRTFSNLPILNLHD